MTANQSFSKKNKYILPVGFSMIILIMIVTNIFAISKISDTSEMMANSISNTVEYQLQPDIKNTLSKFKSDNDQILKTIIGFDIFSVMLSVFFTVYVLRRQKEKDLVIAKLANTDSLTELPNRDRFIELVDEHIAGKPDQNCAIIFFDIDYFKTINDNYGHEFGDLLLKQFADKISGSITEVDVLSRFGGDEFVLLLRSCSSHKKITAFVHELSAKLDASYTIDNDQIFVTSSIGVSLYSKDATTARTLLKNADVAMYQSKQLGRNCYQFYSKESNKRIEKNHTISHRLHTILKDNNKNGELYLMYQPLMNISEGEITECEALIRWKNADGSLIMPDEFIPLAEKSNLIEKINLFVINEACHQQVQWQQQGVKNVRININLSGNKLIFKKLLKQFNQNLRSMNLSPSQFGIELTERTLNQVSEETIFELEKIRDLGMKIAIDDFGTDYSSLISLKKLPITTLKIDKDFIAGLPSNKDDYALVKTIINLGHSLKLDIVAEGVETFEQLKFLKDNSCTIAQGYYFHRPLESEKIVELKQAA